MNNTRKEGKSCIFEKEGKKLSRRKKLPVVLDQEEQESLINVFNERYPTAYRNKTMVKLMLAIGLRLSEALNLQWDHINLMTGKLKVVDGKGAKDRMLWINNETLEDLKRWKERQSEELNKREIENPPELVFTSLKGKRLNDANFRKMIYKYSDKAGVKKNISPHTLRHSFATDLYRETKNIRLVQKALGHEDLSTTMIYTHIVDDELEEAMKNFRS